jgi:hypothetical protein
MSFTSRFSGTRDKNASDVIPGSSRDLHMPAPLRPTLGPRTSQCLTNAKANRMSLPSCGNLCLILKALLRKAFVRDGSQDISLEPPHPR